jgi:ribosome-associated protein
MSSVMNGQPGCCAAEKNFTLNCMMTKHRAITSSLLGNELIFTTSRSSGPGGQNVNKVNSKVTLKFDVANSQQLTDDEKAMISGKLASRMTTDGVILLTSQDKRSQLQNKEAVIAKFEKLVAKAFEKKKTRKPTKPSKGAIQNRIKTKKQLSEKKKWRQKPV